jgi:hypothetical protein
MCNWANLEELVFNKCYKKLPLIQSLITVKISREGLEVYGRRGKNKDCEYYCRNGYLEHREWVEIAWR